MGEWLEALIQVSGERRGVILVIDDDDGVRQVTAAALEDDGWQVFTAENGKVALAVLNQISPDAIVLDLRMPVMDGLAFAELYRVQAAARAPLILMSATVTESAIRRSGAVAGLRKPVDLDVLLRTVGHYAGKSRTD